MQIYQDDQKDSLLPIVLNIGNRNYQYNLAYQKTLIFYKQHHNIYYNVYMQIEVTF